MSKVKQERPNVSPVLFLVSPPQTNKLLDHGPMKSQGSIRSGNGLAIPEFLHFWKHVEVGDGQSGLMNNYTERTWVMITVSDSIKKLMATYVKYPPRKLQSESYSGPVTLTNYQRFQWVREQLAKEGVSIAMPTGN